MQVEWKDEVNIMEQTDVKILKCLRADARENASLISEKIGMSVSAVIDRIRKMENNGLIECHTTIINHRKAGKDVVAILQVALEHPRYSDDFRATVEQLPEVLECYFVTGEFDYMIKIITDNTESLELLLHTVKSIPGVHRTLTSVVMSTVKFEASVDPEQLTVKSRR